MEFVQWEPNADDDAAIGQLQRVGRTLEKELAQLEAYRTSKLNRYAVAIL